MGDIYSWAQEPGLSNLKFYIVQSIQYLYSYHATCMRKTFKFELSEDTTILHLSN